MSLLERFENKLASSDHQTRAIRRQTSRPSIGMTPLDTIERMDVCLQRARVYMPRFLWLPLQGGFMLASVRALPRSFRHMRNDPFIQLRAEDARLACPDTYPKLTLDPRPLSIVARGVRRGLLPAPLHVAAGGCVGALAREVRRARWQPERRQEVAGAVRGASTQRPPDSNEGRDDSLAFAEV